MVAGLGLKIVTFQPFRDFEGMPEPARTRTFARAERKFDLMGELGCDLLMICSNVAPDFARRHRPRGSRLPRARRARKNPRHQGRLRGAGLGKHISDYRDSWEVVRRADHPAIGLTLDSFHIFSRKTDLKAIRRSPPTRSRWCSLPTRHGSIWTSSTGAGTSAASPAKGVPAHRFHGCGVRHRLQRHPVAGNLQRPVPRRLAARRPGRWPALADLSDGRDARPAGSARERSAEIPVRGKSSASSPSSSPPTTARPPSWPNCSRVSASPRSASTSRRR